MVKAFLLGALASATQFPNFPINVGMTRPVYDDEGVIDHLLIVTASGLRFHLQLEAEQS